MCWQRTVPNTYIKNLTSHLHTIIRAHNFDFDIRFWPISALISKTLHRSQIWSWVLSVIYAYDWNKNAVWEVEWKYLWFMKKWKSCTFKCGNILKLSDLDEQQFEWMSFDQKSRRQQRKNNSIHSWRENIDSGRINREWNYYTLPAPPPPPFSSGPRFDSR